MLLSGLPASKRRLRISSPVLTGALLGPINWPFFFHRRSIVNIPGDTERWGSPDRWGRLALCLSCTHAERDEPLALTYVILLRQA